MFPKSAELYQSVAQIDLDIFAYKSAKNSVWADGDLSGQSAALARSDDTVARTEQNTAAAPNNVARKPLAPHRLTVSFRLARLMTMVPFVFKSAAHD